MPSTTHATRKGKATAQAGGSATPVGHKSPYIPDEEVEDDEEVDEDQVKQKGRQKSSPFHFQPPGMFPPSSSLGGSPAPPLAKVSRQTRVSTASPSEGVLFSDEIALSKDMQVTDISIPLDIRVLASCRRSPPLTLFTPSSLARIRAGVSGKMVKISTGKNSTTQAIDVSKFPAEETLDQASWMASYGTFLRFMDAVSDPLIAQSWKEHYAKMIADPFLDRWFPAYRVFDSEIRAQFFRKEFLLKPYSATWDRALDNAKLNYSAPLSLYQLPDSAYEHTSASVSESGFSATEQQNHLGI